MKYSKDQIPFQDILIKRNENAIWMDLYHKLTDTQRCLLFTSSDTNHSKRNMPFSLARRICTIAENNAWKLKNLENLKSDLSKYHYPDSLIKQGFRKAVSMPQKDLQKSKKPSDKNILPFITTFNPNCPNIYSTIKPLVNCLKNNNVSGFHNINLMQSKHQPLNLKNALIKVEYGEVLSGTFNRSDKRCECCNYLLINDHYSFKSVPISFKLKNRFTCFICNLIYVVICDKYKEEYIGEIGKKKLN